MKRARLAVLSLCCAAFACASDPIDSHPSNPEIQRQVTAIVKLVRDQQGNELLASLQRLVAFDVFAVNQVAALAEDPNPRLRGNALWVLSQIRDTEQPARMATIERCLRNGLEDPDSSVVYEAATGLASRGEWDVLPRLIDGLGDRDPSVRYRCHQQLVATTSRDFGYSIDGTPEQREVAMAAWREWYASWQKTQS